MSVKETTLEIKLENLKEQIASAGYELIERNFIEVVKLDVEDVKIEGEVVMVSSKYNSVYNNIP